MFNSHWIYPIQTELVEINEKWPKKHLILHKEMNYVQFTLNLSNTDWIG